MIPFAIGVAVGAAAAIKAPAVYAYVSAKVSAFFASFKV